MKREGISKFIGKRPCENCGCIRKRVEKFDIIIIRVRWNIVWHQHNCHIVLAASYFYLFVRQIFSLSFFSSVCWYLVRLFFFHIIFRQQLEKQRLHKLTQTPFFCSRFATCRLLSQFSVWYVFCFCHIFHRSHFFPTIRSCCSCCRKLGFVLRLYSGVLNVHE